MDWTIKLGVIVVMLTVPVLFLTLLGVLPSNCYDLADSCPNESVMMAGVILASLFGGVSSGWLANRLAQWTRT